MNQAIRIQPTRWATLLPLYAALAMSVSAADPDAPAPVKKKSHSITPEQLQFFEKKIRPVLVEKCYDCHSEESGKMKSDFVLDSRDGIRIGGERGPGIVPFKPDDSFVIRAIRQEGRLAMPPDSKGGILPDEVIADFEKWVSMGAPDPRDASKVASTEPLKPEKPVDWAKEREFWAFQKPQATPPPKVRDAKWPKSDIDRFILAKLEEKGLKPVADADKRALTRRVYYDLTGLPPTPEQLEAFIKDRSQNALENLVDHLLASRHFGEQWGRAWLDVARYGESTGLDRNLNFPYAWKYRDYVISSFNADKPYDRFIQEQIAGDLLSYKDQAERDQLLIATGFLAIGPKGLNETRPKYSKFQVVDDQIDTTTRGFLGLTVSCARCHDHKFDPIPTRDYHALAGIFSSTDTLYGTVGGRGNRRPTPLLGLAGNPDRDVLNGGGPTPNMAVNTNRNFNGRTNNFANRRGGTNGAAGRRGGFGPRPTNAEPVERVAARGPYAMGVKDLEPADSPLYFRGDLSKPKEVVPRGFLRILELKDAPALPEDSSGRLQYAEWITHPENPLTARVAVNRAWQQLFGVGIVATSDNFGHLGVAPTHPELLDYLAAKFVSEQNWSIKQLVRSLVLTRAYQLSSQIAEKANEVDPGNTLLWRASPRRLKAESIRDSILAASGRLDLEPLQGAVTADFGDGYYGVNIWPTDFPTDFRKRSVYLPVPRDVVPEELSLFDFPNPNLVIARREDTTSPNQALYLLNNPFVQSESVHFARRLLTAKESDEKRIRQAYKATLLREPTSAEIKRARQFIREQVHEYQGSDDLSSLTSNDENGTLTLEIVSNAVRANGTPAEVVKRTSKLAAVEKPRDQQEAAWSLFTQSLFANAEFRYLR
ncbi:MAG TPA: PSD1 and planctomycete cytochrome C domain-containing protein [Verrucomicrobiota bacterium]|nr:PSD1 and planctomycete cytochrome C domain-containing protein [Verrucomicrobiota bacterium]